MLSIRDAFNRMTPRELKIVELLSEGKNYVEIAKEIGISNQSWGSYRSRISNKLGLPRTLQVRQRMQKAVELYQELRTSLDDETSVDQILGIPSLDAYNAHGSIGIPVPDPDTLDGPPEFLVSGNRKADIEHKRLVLAGYKPELYIPYHIMERNEVALIVVYCKRLT